MSFRITGLSPEPFQPLFALSDAELAARGAAFDRAGMMLDADVVDGPALEPLIARLLGDPRADCLHIHFARPGCYAARVERA